MTRKQLHLWAAALAAVLVTGGCTATVAGSAKPVPGQGPVAATDPSANPCALLTPDQAAVMGLAVPGRLFKADPAAKSPAECLWHPADPKSGLDNVTADYAVGMSFNEYHNGAVPGEKFELSGLTWTRYPSLLGPKHCTLSTVLPDKSFVVVGSQDQKDASKACVQAQSVAPAVVSHLPGGNPSPNLTPPPSVAKRVPSGPLATLDPCTLLSAEQVAQLKLADHETLKSDTVPEQTGCEWHDTDGRKTGVRALDVWINPIASVREWSGAHVGGQPLTVGGREWLLFPHDNGDRTSCLAILAVTETSSVMATSGFLDDENKACDVVQAVLPMLSVSIPVA